MCVKGIEYSDGSGGVQVDEASDLLTMPEMMALLRYKSRKPVLKAIRTQRLPAKKVGGQWRFPRVPVMRWLEGGGAR